MRVGVAVATGVAVGVGSTVGIVVAIGVAVGVSIDLRRRRSRDTAVVPLVVSCSIAHGLRRWHTFLECLHLGLLGLVVSCPERGKEVDEEAGHINAENECYDPLQNGGNIPNILSRADGECDYEAELGDDEEEFEPERSSQDGMLTMADSQTLILPADEDGADDVSTDENGEKNVMQAVVVAVVVNGKEDKTGSTADCECSRTEGVELLPV